MVTTKRISPGAEEGAASDEGEGEGVAGIAAFPSRAVGAPPASRALAASATAFAKLVASMYSPPSLPAAGCEASWARTMAAASPTVVCWATKLVLVALTPLLPLPPARATIVRLHAGHGWMESGACGQQGL